MLSNQTTYHHYLNYRSSELNVIKHYFQSRIWSFDRSNHFISFIYWFQLVTVETWKCSSSPLLQPYHISHAHFMVSSPLVFFSLYLFLLCVCRRMYQSNINSMGKNQITKNFNEYMPIISKTYKVFTYFIEIFLLIQYVFCRTCRLVAFWILITLRNDREFAFYLFFVVNWFVPERMHPKMGTIFVHKSKNIDTYMQILLLLLTKLLSCVIYD